MPTALEAAAARSVRTVDDVNVWVAGASRLARIELEGQLDTRPEAFFRRLAVEVSGPLLANFALWTLENAATGDIRRLFFPSPRCDTAFEVTRQVAEFLDLDIDVRQVDGEWPDWRCAASEALAEDRRIGAQVSDRTTESLLAAGVGNAEGDAVVGTVARGAAIEGLHRVLRQLGRGSVQGYFLEAEEPAYADGGGGHLCFLPPRLRETPGPHDEALLGTVTMSDPIEHSAALLAA